MAQFTLANARGHRVVLDSNGAAIAGICVADYAGTIADVTVPAGASAGKSIGRYANRIARGELVLDGVTYQLLTNEGHNTLHGGPDGFAHRDWQIAQSSSVTVEFVLHSPDGDQGFPGAMTCHARYTWTDDDRLRLEYSAFTDKPTVVNLTNHVYFNLSAGGSSDIATHELQIDASTYTPLDDELIPTGAIVPLAGRSKDFSAPRAIGSEAYDCNFVLHSWNGTLRRAARACDPHSGRELTIETTQPGLQLYTGKPGAFALETQHFADAPHHSNFPSTVLRPGQRFQATTIYGFRTVAPRRA